MPLGSMDPACNTIERILRWAREYLRRKAGGSFILPFDLSANIESEEIIDIDSLGQHKLLENINSALGELQEHLDCECIDYLSLPEIKQMLIKLQESSAQEAEIGSYDSLIASQVAEKTSLLLEELD